jgi:hypothetical protein
MARVSITKSNAPGSYPTAGVSITWTDADATNKNQFTMGGNDLLLVRNGHASTAKTVTINSVPDAQGRSRDITAESLAAGVTRAFGPFKEIAGWAQSGGTLNCEGEDNNIKFAVISLPLNQ